MGNQLGCTRGSKEDAKDAQAERKPGKGKHPVKKVEDGGPEGQQPEQNGDVSDTGIGKKESVIEGVDEKKDDEKRQEGEDTETKQETEVKVSAERPAEEEEEKTDDGEPGSGEPEPKGSDSPAEEAASTEGVQLTVVEGEKMTVKETTVEGEKLMVQETVVTSSAVSTTQE